MRVRVVLLFFFFFITYIIIKNELYLREKITYAIGGPKLFINKCLTSFSLNHNWTYKKKL